MKKKIIIIITAIIAAIVLRYGIAFLSNYFQSLAIKKKPAPPVSLYEVGEKNVIRSFEAPGRVVSQYRVEVLARIAGYLQKSFFKEGDDVKEGQVLFQIEQNEYLNAANDAAANVKNLRAQLDYAEKQLVRASELVKKDYIAKSKYDQILSQRDSLRAQLTSANARSSDAQRNLGYTIIKSPVNGKIGIINVTVGNYVTPSAGALTTINSTNPIYVTFPLDSKDFQAIVSSDGDDNKNRKVEIILAGGTKYEFDGVQDFQDNKIDISTGTVTLRATFKNPDNKLIHGDFVTVKLYANHPTNVPIVPIAAVMENQAGKYVYKIGEKNIPELVYIKTSAQSGDNWLISDGVKRGDKIIFEGLQKVVPGKPVTIVSSDEMKKIKTESVTKNKGTKILGQ